MDETGGALAVNLSLSSSLWGDGCVLSLIRVIRRRVDRLQPCPTTSMQYSSDATLPHDIDAWFTKCAPAKSTHGSSATTVPVRCRD